MELLARTYRPISTKGSVHKLGHTMEDEWGGHGEAGGEGWYRQMANSSVGQARVLREKI